VKPINENRVVVDQVMTYKKDTKRTRVFESDFDEAITTLYVSKMAVPQGTKSIHVIVELDPASADD